jgi:7-cyano-7-deazaguanine reductase
MNKKYGEKIIEESNLEVWENPNKNQDYIIEISTPELTCLCPRSGFPDFAKITIYYIPKDYIVELKSLKLYLNKYRNTYISHEAIINQIFKDLQAILKPKYLKVIGDFNPRGNLKTIITVSTDKKDYKK